MSTDGTGRQVGTAWRCERERKDEGVVEDSLSKTEPMQGYTSNLDFSYNMKHTAVSDTNLERPYSTENTWERSQSHNGNNPVLVARPWQARRGTSPPNTESVDDGGVNLTPAAPVTLQHVGAHPGLSTCNIQLVDAPKTNVPPTLPVLRAWPDVGPRKAQFVKAGSSNLTPLISSPPTQAHPRVSCYYKEFEDVKDVTPTSATTAVLPPTVPQLGVAPYNREEVKNSTDVQPSVTKSASFLQRQQSGTQHVQKLATLFSPKGWKAAQQYRSLGASVSAFRRFSKPQVHSTADDEASNGASMTDPSFKSS